MDKHSGQIIKYVKMICKSIDALTREIYLLRTGNTEKNEETDPPSSDRA